MNYIQSIRKKVGHQAIIGVVAIGLLKERNKLLLVRKKGRRDWGLPGGFMEVGETGSKTIEREFFEETGLKVRVTKLFGVYDNYPMQKYPNGDKAWVIHLVYKCKKVGGKIKPDGKEIEEVAFFPMPVTIKRHQKLLDDFQKKTPRSLRGA